MTESIDKANEINLLNSFIESVKEDPRINMAHISLYVSLVSHWYAKWTGKSSLCFQPGYYAGL